MVFLDGHFRRLLSEVFGYIVESFGNLSSYGFLIGITVRLMAIKR